MRIFFSIIDDWRGERRDVWLEGDADTPRVVAGRGPGPVERADRQPWWDGDRLLPAERSARAGAPRRRRPGPPASGRGRTPLGSVEPAGELRAVAGPHAGPALAAAGRAPSDRALRRGPGQPGGATGGSPAATPSWSTSAPGRSPSTTKAPRTASTSTASPSTEADLTPRVPPAGRRHRPGLGHPDERPGRGGARRGGRTAVQPPARGCSAQLRAGDGPLPGIGSGAHGRQLSPDGLGRPGPPGRGAWRSPCTNPQFLLFTLLSPVIGVSNYVTQRRGGTRTSPRPQPGSPPGVEPAEADLAAARRRKTARRARPRPDPATLAAVAAGPRSACGSGVGATRTSCWLRIGLADLPASI